MLDIAVEHADQPEVLKLLEFADAYSAALYPAGHRHPVDAAFLAGNSVRLLVARENGRAIGCGALVFAGDDWGELKRLIVHPDARKQGIGSALLRALEVMARAGKLSRLLLETGPKSTGALHLYTGSGYQLRGPFGGYLASEHSVFMEKWLA